MHVVQADKFLNRAADFDCELLRLESVLGGSGSCDDEADLEATVKPCENDFVSDGRNDDTSGNIGISGTCGIRGIVDPSICQSAGGSGSAESSTPRDILACAPLMERFFAGPAFGDKYVTVGYLNFSVRPPKELSMFPQVGTLEHSSRRSRALYFETHIWAPSSKRQREVILCFHTPPNAKFLKLSPTVLFIMSHFTFNFFYR